MQINESTAGDVPVKLRVGPLNIASQAAAWARAVRDDLRCEASTLAFDGPVARRLKGRYRAGVNDRADDSLPHYQLSPSWARRLVAQRYFRATTHFLNEGNTATVGDPRRSRFTDEAAWFRSRGISTAVVFHGSDARDPDRSMESDPHSFFHFAPPQLVERLRRTSLENRSAVSGHDFPVFVTTPDMLAHVEDSRLLPLSVDIEQWASVPDIFPTRVPRVLHRPSGEGSVIKGSESIIPVLEEFERKGWIEIVRSGTVAHSAMRRLYSETDIVVDQLRIGSYGATAVEAMAAGRVVVANVDQARAQYEDGFPPIANANPETFRDVLGHLVSDTSFARQTAAAGVVYTRRWHDGRQAAEALRSFLTD